MRRIIVPVVLALVIALLAAAAAFAVDSTTSFKMVRSQKAATDNDCLKGAKAHVDVRTTPTDNQIMDVIVNHAPKNTEFELFVTQLPNSPFGVSWCWWWPSSSPGPRKPRKNNNPAARIT